MSFLNANDKTKTPPLLNDIKSLIGQYADVKSLPVATYLSQQDVKSNTLRNAIGGYSPRKYIELFNLDKSQLDQIITRNDPKEIKMATDVNTNFVIMEGKYVELYRRSVGNDARLAYFIGLADPLSILVMQDDMGENIAIWKNISQQLYPRQKVNMRPFYDIAIAFREHENLDNSTIIDIGKLNMIFDAALDNEDYDEALTIGERTPGVVYYDGYNPIRSNMYDTPKNKRIIKFIIDNFFFTQNYGYGDNDQGASDVIDALIKRKIWDLAEKAIIKRAEGNYIWLLHYAIENSELDHLFEILIAMNAKDINGTMQSNKVKKLIESINIDIHYLWYNNTDAKGDNKDPRTNTNDIKSDSKDVKSDVKDTKVDDIDADEVKLRQIFYNRLIKVGIKPELIEAAVTAIEQEKIQEKAKREKAPPIFNGMFSRFH